MIPMMVLSGAMFSFDKMNRSVSRFDKVPLIAEFMVTKWTYEALMVHQFKDNEFTRQFYDFDRIESQSDFKMVYWLPEMRKRLDEVRSEYQETQKIVNEEETLQLLYNEIKKEIQIPDSVRFSVLFNLKKEIEKTKKIKRQREYPNKFDELDKLNSTSFNIEIAEKIETYLDRRERFYSRSFAEIVQLKDNLINLHLEKHPESYKNYRDWYFNEGIADIIKKVYESNKILEYRNELIQHYDPIYQNPVVEGNLDFRSHFFSPSKQFLGRLFDTYYFNIAVVWILTLIFYFILYYNLLKKLVSISETLKRRR